MYFIKKTKKVVSFVLIVFFTSLSIFFTSNTFAQNTSSPFHWDYINVDINVEDNGDMLITETQKYVFTKPHSNERYRYIPLDKVDNITDVAVFEDDKPLTIQTGIENNKFWIKWKLTINLAF